MCTVVTRHAAGEALQVLAVRDELVSRPFDDPAAWWPDHPGVVGGRDRQAGGSWCVSDVAGGVTALVLNRVERRHGVPSRGVLPLAAVEHGTAWPEHVAHEAMASFTLVLAAPDRVEVWTWDAADLVHAELAPGTHVMTTAGVDADDAKTGDLAVRVAQQPWLDVLAALPPRDDPTALIVRHPVEGGDTYATVFGQLITAVPGRLEVAYSHAPWLREGWTNARFGQTDARFSEPGRAPRHRPGDAPSR